MDRDELVEALRLGLAELTPARLEAPGMRRAAVLAPIVFKAGVPHVLFTQRSMDVRTHKGQVSFPGGGIELEDASPLAAALRETEEEIGVPPERVETLGQLDEVTTNAATYAITPFVGTMDDGVAHITSDLEVARILEVPLAYLLDERNRQPDLKTHHWKYVWEGIEIWGATAKMVNQLLHILGLVDPFAEDVALLRTLADADRVHFTELLLELHPRGQSALAYLREHPDTAAESLRALVRR